MTDAELTAAFLRLVDAHGLIYPQHIAWSACPRFARTGCCILCSSVRLISVQRRADADWSLAGAYGRRYWRRMVRREIVRAMAEKLASRHVPEGTLDIFGGRHG